MSENQFRRQRNDRGDEPRFGRFILLSSILHLALALGFGGIGIRHAPPPPRPVYYVDLSQLPVADPRAGRPDGRQEEPRSTPREPAPPATPPVPKPAPAPAPRPAPQPAPKPEPKPAPKPEPKPAPRPEPKPAPRPEPKPAPQEDPAASAIERMRRERERAALRERIAQLAGQDSRSASAPQGMPDGSGSEAGISRQLWLEERLRQNWSLSRYQVTRRDLVAVVRITYSADGRLLGNRFISSSGDSTFDDSVTRAILRTPQLDFAPGQTWEVPVTFNLKDLMD